MRQACSSGAAAPAPRARTSKVRARSNAGPHAAPRWVVSHAPPPPLPRRPWPPSSAAAASHSGHTSPGAAPGTGWAVGVWLPAAAAPSRRLAEASTSGALLLPLLQAGAWRAAGVRHHGQGHLQQGQRSGGALESGGEAAGARRRRRPAPRGRQGAAQRGSVAGHSSTTPVLHVTLAQMYPGRQPDWSWSHEALLPPARLTLLPACPRTICSWRRRGSQLPPPWPLSRPWSGWTVSTASRARAATFWCRWVLRRAAALGRAAVGDGGRWRAGGQLESGREFAVEVESSLHLPVGDTVGGRQEGSWRPEAAARQLRASFVAAAGRAWRAPVDGRWQAAGPLAGVATRSREGSSAAAAHPCQLFPSRQALERTRALDGPSASPRLRPTLVTCAHQPTARPIVLLRVQALEREGVDTLFAYPGGASMEIHQALTRSESIRNILCRHEQVRLAAARPPPPAAFAV